MKATNLIQLASEKGLQITRFKKGIYQYSNNGYEWTNVNCTYLEFVKIIKSL